MIKSAKTVLVMVAAGALWPCAAAADLAERIDNILNRVSERKVRYGICIVRAADGQCLYTHNAGEPMVPASNMKLVTAAAALKYLGPNYEYQTLVGLSGQDLVVIGSGDPLLGDRPTDAKYARQADWVLSDIAEALKQRGITRIRNIIVDTRLFDNVRVHPSWPVAELNRPYACEVSALNYNSNCVRITAANIAGRVTLKLQPPTSYLKITNKVVATSKAPSTIGSYRSTWPNAITVYGRCNKEAGFDVAIERPPAFFAHLLAESLANAGIRADGVFVETALSTGRQFVVLRRYCTPITDLLVRCNKDSFGLAAESLFKTLATRTNPQPAGGSWQAGREKITDYLLGLGLSKSEFYIDDGSGLSTKNTLSANTITTVLLDLYRSECWQAYKNSLAVGGDDGTLGRQFRDSRYRGKILAKTGYIQSVKSLSGLCCTSEGEFVFSILANEAGGKTRGAINDIVEAIIDHHDR